MQQTFHEYLRAALARMQVSQHEIARRLKVSNVVVSAWTRGVSLPGPGNVIALASMLDEDEVTFCWRWTLAKAARQEAARSKKPC